MASFLHNVDQVWCHQSEIQWLVSGELNQNESDMLHTTANTSKAMHLRSFHLMQF